MFVLSTTILFYYFAFAEAGCSVKSLGTVPKNCMVAAKEYNTCRFGRGCAVFEWECPPNYYQVAEKDCDCWFLTCPYKNEVCERKEQVNNGKCQTCDPGYMLIDGGRKCKLSSSPTVSPTPIPTRSPSQSPTLTPTQSPSLRPTTISPTQMPSSAPTASKFSPINSAIRGNENDHEEQENNDMFVDTVTNEVPLENKKKNSTGLIITIVVVVIVMLCIIFFMLANCKKKSNSKEDAGQEDVEIEVEGVRAGVHSSDQAENTLTGSSSTAQYEGKEGEARFNAGNPNNGEGKTGGMQSWGEVASV